MDQPTFTIKVTRWDQTFLTLTVFVQGRGRIVFDGDAYWQWQFTTGPLRNHNRNVSWNQLLHDALEGWHSSPLHAGGEVAILPWHSDYSRVAQIVEWGETLTDSEMIAILLEDKS